ncbi:retrovirus-related pol polyprotein from transposon TNT 1-94 [Tanacetum coccineum]
MALRLKSHYEKLVITHQTSIARTPQQNGIVERRNRTFVEVARTILVFSKAPEFLWAEAISTACFTQFRVSNLQPQNTENYENHSIQVYEYNAWILNTECFRTDSNALIFEDSSAESNQTPSKEDLNDLFGPLYEEYYENRQPEVSTNSDAPTTLHNEDTPSSSTIIADDNEAPQILSTSEEPTSLISNDLANE